MNVYKGPCREAYATHYWRQGPSDSHGARTFTAPGDKHWSLKKSLPSSSLSMETLNLAHVHYLDGRQARPSDVLKRKELIGRNGGMPRLTSNPPIYDSEKAGRWDHTKVIRGIKYAEVLHSYITRFDVGWEVWSPVPKRGLGSGSSAPEGPAWSYCKK